MRAIAIFIARMEASASTASVCVHLGTQVSTVRKYYQVKYCMLSLNQSKPGAKSDSYLLTLHCLVHKCISFRQSHTSSKQKWLHTQSQTYSTCDSNFPKNKAHYTSNSLLPACSAGRVNPKWLHVSYSCTLTAISCTHRPGRQLPRGPEEFGV